MSLRESALQTFNIHLMLCSKWGASQNAAAHVHNILEYQHPRKLLPALLHLSQQSAECNRGMTKPSHFHVLLKAEQILPIIAAS